MTIAEVYPLHLASMDTQHARIDFMIEELAGMLGFSAQEKTSLFHSVVQYTKLHFADEEQFMKSCGYPEIHFHEAEHAQLIGQLDAIESHFQKPGSHGLKDF